MESSSELTVLRTDGTECCLGRWHGLERLLTSKSGRIVGTSIWAVLCARGGCLFGETSSFEQLESSYLG